MALSDILLRTLSHPTLSAKGSALTWVEEDTNFVEIYEALVNVSDFTNSGVAAYDGGTTYSEDDIVSYNGFLYTYINPVAGSGNAPTNPTYWELTGGASLAHVQNKDQYLDFGGTYEVSAQEIRTFIDTPLDISTKWDITGNTLAARGVFGSTSGAYGWDYKVNNTVYGGISNTGKWFWGTTSAFTDTDHSFKGSGNTSGTYNTQWQNSDGTSIAKLGNSGILDVLVGLNVNGFKTLRYKQSSGNIYLGDNTGDENYGTDNLGIGAASLKFINNGSYVGNTAFGTSSLGALTTASYCTGLGGYSLQDLTTGSNNSGLGYSSGNNITTGTNNNFLGSFSGVPSASGTISHSIAIGTESVVRGNNQLTFGSNASTINNVFFGNGQGNIDFNAFAADPVYIHANGDVANTTDNNNANAILHLRGARAVGNGNPAGVKIQYSPKVGTGTTYQSFQDALSVDGATGNIGLWGASFGSGEKVMFISNAGTVPSADPTGGFILYVDPADDKLKARGPGGLVTVLANPV